MTGSPMLARTLRLTLGVPAMVVLAACGSAVATPGRTVTVTAPAVTIVASPPTSVVPSSTAPTSSAPTTSAATSSAPAPTASRAGSGDFDRAAFTYLKSRKGAYGFSAVDLTTGTTLEHNPGQRCETASMIKLDVLLTLLLQRQDAGRELSSSERALTHSMIIYSDNNATTALWGRIGRDGAVREANKRFGMSETEPGTRYRWGLSTTTARDQVRLLRNLVKDDLLDKTHRDYALDLLGKVSPGQDWGVSAANPRHDAQLKNGWLPRPEGWVVTSAGRVRTAKGHDVLMSVVSCRGASQQGSIESIEHLASMAAGTFDAIS